MLRSIGAICRVESITTRVLADDVCAQPDMSPASAAASATPAFPARSRKLRRVHRAMKSSPGSLAFLRQWRQANVCREAAKDRPLLKQSQRSGVARNKLDDLDAMSRHFYGILADGTNGGSLTCVTRSTGPISFVAA